MYSTVVCVNVTVCFYFLSKITTNKDIKTFVYNSLHLRYILIFFKYKINLFLAEMILLIILH